MLGQGILPFYAGWATARGTLAGGEAPGAILAALAATLIIGGMYPLTQIYQLDADAQRGDLTAARFLGVENSFRLARLSVGVGGIGAAYVAFTHFSAPEGAGLLVFILALLAAITLWRKRFFAQSAMQNFYTLMRLYAGVTLPFLAWIFARLLYATWA
jgi:1,4-dihydroxy-2-naphthoate octaprenyltransferase